MSTTFRPYEPEQSLLLPPSPRDWLAENHLAYFISDTIEALDLSGFFARYEGDGGGGRLEGQGQRQPAQGDELQENESGGQAPAA